MILALIVGYSLGNEIAEKRIKGSQYEGQIHSISADVRVNSPSSLTFSLIGASEHFSVPSGYDMMTVTASGGNGGPTNFNPGNGQSPPSGGLGGTITATYSVIPGQIFYVCVGGAGGMPSAGYYDGGVGSTDTLFNNYGGGGGGSSDILMAGSCARILTAGGGGGAGFFYSGGPGGAINFGASPSNAQSAPNEINYPPAGAGGGGYVGGMAGLHSSFGGGGTGGTSYTTGTLMNIATGVNYGDGQVNVTFSSSGNPITNHGPQPNGTCYCIPPTTQPTASPTMIPTAKPTGIYLSNSTYNLPLICIYQLQLACPKGAKDCGMPKSNPATEAPKNAPTQSKQPATVYTNLPAAKTKAKTFARTIV